MQLSPAAQRVLGSLVEKSLTTPQQYPLTLAALQAACNQRSAREPVMELSEGEVHHGLRELRDHDLSRTAPVRGRATRYQHELAVQLDLDEAAQTVLGVLLLRGPQTVGEVRTRTERWHEFTDLDEVETVLGRLADHPFLALAAELPREPGRREARWNHLLGPPAEQVLAASPRPTATPDARADAPAPGGAAAPTAGALAERVAALEDEVAGLREELARTTSRLDTLLAELG